MAVLIEYVVALTADDDGHWLGLEPAELREVSPQMAPRCSLQCFNVVVGVSDLWIHVYRYCSSRCGRANEVWCFGGVNCNGTSHEWFVRGRA